MKPLNTTKKLAPNPTDAPKYPTEINSISGDKITLGDPKVTRALVALMNQHAVIGGAAAHWGGPAAFAEIMSALHGYMFKHSTTWYEKYNFVNDAGHAENGIYALRANLGFDNLTFDDLKKFRSIESKLTGHGEAHLNPEGVFISNGPLGSGLPQAQGLAMADKLIGNERTTICVVSDGASMEGEAKESFAAIPGLYKKGKLNPFLLIISDNNTKLSGRIDQDSFSMSPTFESLEELGWDYKYIENGHDLQAIYQELEKSIAKLESSPDKPIALVFKTVKGFGVNSTEQAASGGHGYPLKPYDSALNQFINEIFNGSTPEEFSNWANEILSNKPQEESNSNEIKKEKVQVGFSQALNELAKEGLPVVSISADLQGSTGVAGFQKENNKNYIDIGVAESNMISSAIGMAKQGLIPIVDTFAQFGITKGNLPIIMASLSQGPIIGLFSHTGFQDAADGASHQATTYFSALSSIPNVDIISCSCSKEAYELMKQTVRSYANLVESGKTPNSTIFFYGRETFLPEHSNQTYDWNKAQVLRQGSEGVIVATGPTVEIALEAANELEKQGRDVTVINNIFVNRPDTETIGEQLNKNNGKLITIEDHQILCGMGSMLSHSLSTKGYNFVIKSLGNNGKFGQSAYKANHLYALHKFDATSVIEAFKTIS